MSEGANRKYDLVVYGATGDAGMGMVSYLAEHYTTSSYSSSLSSPPSSNKKKVLKWAIAGRTPAKLASVKRACRCEEAVDIIVASSSDLASIHAMSKSTRLLLSAVGPYTTLGEPIIVGCLTNNTHYVDITGELDWVGTMRNKYSGGVNSTSIICSFAGYDCIPSEMGIFMGISKLLSHHNHNNNHPLKIDVECIAELKGGVAPRGTLRTSVSKAAYSYEFISNMLQFAHKNTNSHNNINTSTKKKVASSLLHWLLPSFSHNTKCFTLPHFMGWCNIPVVYNSIINNGHDHMEIGTINDRMVVPYSQHCFFTGYGLLQALLYTMIVVPNLLLFGLYTVVLARYLPAFVGEGLLYLFDGIQYRARNVVDDAGLSASTTKVTTYVTSERSSSNESGSTAQCTFFCKGDAGIVCTSLLAVETSLCILDLLDNNNHDSSSLLSSSLVPSSHKNKNESDDEHNPKHNRNFVSPVLLCGHHLATRIQHCDSCTLTVQIVNEGEEKKNE